MFNKLAKAANLALNFLGFYPTVLFINLRSLGWYVRDFLKLKRQIKESGNPFGFGIPQPVLSDKYVASGVLSGHYFHQDLWAARKIFAHQPQKHVDIGSRVDGFVTHVASFREIEVFDIRKTEVVIPNIRFVQADFMKFDEQLVHYTDSLSCLHVIEHFGLGRYGDPVDANGYLTGLDNLYRLLAPGGKFYFSTPIGPRRIEFNAHRVFDLRYLHSLFADKYSIDSFAYVNDRGELVSDVDLAEGFDGNFGCRFGCGLFEMTKR
ncbi:MAG: DUF268 domain-containing protein [Cyclobacteriaceae bacterium]|nr:DUF268 domain-containing protein [Cyclobacteriaceae bacterium]